MITVRHGTNTEPRSSAYLGWILRIYNCDNGNIYKIERERDLPLKNCRAYLKPYVPYGRITLLAGA
jgi:hypothetical protein